MLIPSKVDLHLFLLLILYVIFIYIGKGNKRNISGRIFQIIIIFLSFTVFTEALAWILILTEHPSASTLLSLSVATSSFQSVAWVAYFDYKIYGDLVGTKKRVRFYMIAPVIILFASLVNYLEPGFIFTIHTRQIFWGPGATVPPIAVYILIIVALIYFFKNTEMILGRLTQTLLLFILLPILGSILQFHIVYVPVNWAMYTLALIITFIMVELSELHKDELTNLSTRRQFEDRLKYKLKSREAFGVMMIDLNDFKTINDTKGHQEGDRVLQKVADILVSSINPEDMACRIGGDEFTIIIESNDPVVVQKVKTRITRGILMLNTMQDDVQVGVSIGLRMVTEPAQWDYDVLLSDIDRKMYEEKAKIKSKMV